MPVHFTSLSRKPYVIVGDFFILNYKLAILSLEDGESPEETTRVRRYKYINRCVSSNIDIIAIQITYERT